MGYTPSYPPPHVTSHQVQDLISQNKLAQGQGIWATTKETLLWIIGGSKFSLKLKPDKCQNITNLILKNMQNGKLPVQKVLGDIREATTCVFRNPGK